RIRTGVCGIIRMSYSAVRDHIWETIDPEISIESDLQEDNSFYLGYSAQCLNPENIFRSTGEITAQAGTMNFRFSGEAQRGFEKNRIGLCVLHPIIECTGKPCRIRTGE